LHYDLVGARALDLRAHGDEEICQVDDFGLASGVLEDRLAVGERRRHHQIFSARDSHRVEHEAGALQLRRARPDVTPFDSDIRAHRLQAGHVNVHRPRTDGAATRQRYIGAAEARHERPEHENRSTHGLHELVRREALLHRGAIDFNAHTLVDGDGGAHPTQQFHSRRDVLEVRHVRDRHRIVSEQRGRKNGKRGVFRA
jgi:hypothetical protein